ncbi:antibiotic biosynthesis monooxygenase family protein [Desulfosarcina sp.]|uniref:antibiotic biosynthesis monooxygenase family protein n=1 Tax=Desulfosarcina sp. TaxID=2027861 RepID=UPI0029AD9F3B|nr:antibiotic biosynthesis monooxygenase [Desulfosarcina sp.]MDX2451825.1 antibiotic biosynthesis monooxygenase [Desulfosarcina sp.]MDX2489609.1 antibiotic biosynthesis monooxygenase [Desulfosarcina sp.]
MIRIHIRRHVSEDNQQALMALINQMRSAIVGNPGYVSGETLKRIDQPGEILVVSKWQSHFYWKQWHESRERAALQADIDKLLGEQTQYEIYEYE